MIMTKMHFRNELLKELKLYRGEFSTTQLKYYKILRAIWSKVFKSWLKLFALNKALIHYQHNSWQQLKVKNVPTCKTWPS